MKFKFTVLGCGSSVGVPRIDGNFGECNPKNKKNYRTRCSALISIDDFNILIDTSPDLKYQLLINKVKNINKVFYTHHHADQTHGINELRVFYLKTRKKIPVYADINTKKYLINTFKYCFKTNSHDYPSTLELNNLKTNHSFLHKNKKIFLRSISVKHGNINSIAYIINNKCAYIPDANEIYNKDINLFKNLDFLVIDCLRYKYHPSHFTLNEILKLIKEIKPKKTILTNLNNEIDYSSIKKQLPKNVVPAFDGMSFYI